VNKKKAEDFSLPRRKRENGFGQKKSCENRSVLSEDKKREGKRCVFANSLTPGPPSIQKNDSTVSCVRQTSLHPAERRGK